MIGRLLRSLLAVSLFAPPAAAERIPAAVGAAPDTVAVRHLGQDGPPPPLPSARASAAGASFGGAFYLFGGWDGMSWRDDAWRFDGRTWTALPPLPSAPRLPSAAARSDGRIFVTGAPPQLSARYAWQIASDLGVARNLGQAVRLNDGRILLAGGYTGDVTSLDSVEILDPRSRRWRRAAPMSEARYAMVLAVLRDGRVLAAGGRRNKHNSQARDTTLSEIYDPKTDSWTRTAPMLRAFDNALTYVRPDGKVMAVGGYETSDRNLAVTEVFDPATGKWSAGPPMGFPHNAAAGVTLKDGRFFVTGGSGAAGVQAQTEIYDPMTDRWSRTAPMSAPRYNHALIVLPDGHVLAAGGASASSPSLTAEIYDPMTDSWRGIAGPRNAHTQGAFALVDEKALLVGGTDTPMATPTSDLYDPETRRWLPGPDMSSGRAFLALALLDAKTAIAVGGAPSGYPAASVPTAEVFASRPVSDSMASQRGLETFVYDTRTRRWAEGPPQDRQRTGAALAGVGRRVFSFSGLIEGESGEPSFRRMTEDGWERVGNMPAMAGPGVGVLSNKVYLAGGTMTERRSKSARADLRSYDPDSDVWTELPPMSTPRSESAAAFLEGRFYVAGGRNYLSSNPLEDVEVFDPAARSWSRAAPLPLPARQATAAALDGRLYVIGGATVQDDATRMVQVYDPGTDSWEVVGAARPAAAPPPQRPTAPSPPAFPYPPPALAYTPPPMPTAPTTRYAAKSPERPHDFALVIGVTHYKSLPEADYAEDDALDAAAALRALGVPEENTVTLTGSKATLSEVSKYIEEWLPRRVSPDSRVYFYYSGHGAPDLKDGTAYMMPWDGDPAFVKSTGFGLSRLYDALGSLKAARVVAMIDSCFSGAGGRSVLVAGVRPLVTVKLPDAPSPKISVLTAAEGDEIAGSLPERGHGLFSYYLVRGLTGAAAPDAEHLTLEELYRYVRKGVIVDARRQNREQNPTLRTPNGQIRLY